MQNTVVTFNMFGVPGLRSRHRARLFCQYLRQLEPTILCLQEVHSFSLAKLLRQELSFLPYAAYSPGVVGPAGGLITLSSHEIDPSPSYTSLAEVTRGQGKRLHRSMAGGARHKGVLTVRTGGMNVINAHLSPNIRFDWSPGNPAEPIQRAQVDLLVAESRSAVGPSALCGDLNIEKGSLLYRYLLASTGWIDPFDATRTFRLSDGIHFCLDHMLFGGVHLADISSASVLFGASVPLGKIAPGAVSDHDGLRAVVHGPARIRSVSAASY